MTDISNFEIEILQLINNHRATLQLAPLVFYAAIQAASHQHSNNMAQGSIAFGHDGFAVRANELIQLLKGTAASENVAMGQQSANEVVQSWLNSEGHRKNIEGDYNLTGIAVVKSASGENLFTQIFIKAPLPSIPSSQVSSNPQISDAAVLDAQENLNYTLLKLINKHRMGQYLPILQINPHIQVAATQHAQDMASGKIPFSHDGFQNRAKLLIEKLNGSSAAENVAMGLDDAQVIVNSWLDSNAHRSNIEGDFNLTGIGVAEAEDKKVYYCQIFIKKI